MSQVREDRPLDPAKVLHEAVAGLPPEAADPRFPTLDELRAKFPQYEILGRVGAGGMGAVYRAQDRKLARPVALKVLARELSADPAFTERFLREARALAALQHPHVVAVHDFGEVNGLYYLVMEYVDGVDLRRLMKMGALSPEEALRLAPQICSALQYAHEHGVVHRDVKPENVLVDAEGNVRIADFGLAKLVAKDPQSPTLTRSSQVLGTPRYMAPEQWREGAQVDHRADIYALGVVLYEMLTGDVPMGHFAPPSKRAGTPPRLDAVVQRSLAQEPAERYGSAREVQDDLEDVARGLGGDPARPRSERPATPARPAGEARLYRRPIYALVGLFVIFIAAFASAAAWQRQEFQYRDWESRAAAHEAILDARGAAIAEGSTPRWDDPGSRPEEPERAVSLALGAPLLLLTLLVSLAVLTWAGVSSIRKIRASEGRLRGMGLAVTCAWCVPLAVVNALFLVPLSLLEDNDLFYVIVGPWILLCLVGDVYFLAWQTRRQLAAR